MFISTGQFVHDVLPGLMRGRSAFGALLATYNEFEMPTPDRIPEGLDIRAMMGSHRSLDDRLCALRQLATEPLRESDRYAREQKEAFIRVASQPFRKGAFDLAVVYLGFSQFDRALTYAQQLKSGRVAEHTVILTCDCDSQEKTRKIIDLSARCRFDAALLTPKCGGHPDLSQLAAGLIEVWPQVRAR